MSVTHSYIDAGATAIVLYVGFRMPMLAVGLPHYFMMGLQCTALVVGITTGILTCMNMIGYTPRWLKRVKTFFKRISK